MRGGGSASAGHVIVAGLDRLGLRISELLCGMGERVAVIAADPAAELRAMATAAGASVVSGDYRSPDVELIGGRVLLVKRAAASRWGPAPDEPVAAIDPACLERLVDITARPR